MKALLVFGARPDFMKIAAVYRSLDEDAGCHPVLVNTGQHYDDAVSDAFGRSLELPRPDVHLQAGSGSRAQQMARVLTKLEAILRSVKPDVVVVAGHTSAALAAALAAVTVRIPVAHVEAGLRSGDWATPEEWYRVVTDRLSRYLFASSVCGVENLRAEAIGEERIFLVGSLVIDTLDWVTPRLACGRARAKYQITDGAFVLVTLHQPGNVDDPAALGAIITGLERVGRRVPVFFVIHSRTQQRIADFGIGFDPDLVRPLPLLGYPEFISLLSQAACVVTDSGAIQEETTVLGVPCLTLQRATDRPITLEFGRNELVCSEAGAIVEAVARALRQPPGGPGRPPLWDGRTAERIVEVLRREVASGSSPRREEGAGARARVPARPALEVEP